jgi:hypothetical protein
MKFFASRSEPAIVANDFIAPMLVGIEPSLVWKVAVGERAQFFRDDGQTNAVSFVPAMAILG